LAITDAIALGEATIIVNHPRVVFHFWGPVDLLASSADLSEAEPAPAGFTPFVEGFAFFRLMRESVSAIGGASNMVRRMLGSRDTVRPPPLPQGRTAGATTLP
jgi:hypothetical protein